MSDSTINYYNKFADSFTKNTISIDFNSIQNRFISKLPKNGYILDFGCGSGRDTKFFLNNGFKVDAIDGSIELCNMASDYTGIKVQHVLFQDFNSTIIYDGIWACASILHLNKKEIIDLLNKIKNNLNNNGLMYLSFKYGTFEGIRNNRYFTDMTEDTFNDILSNINGLELLESWQTTDARPNRDEEKWLNLILKKI